MTDPAVLQARPYLRYVASSSAEPRVEHMKWYNLVLPAEHEFWKTHHPPNGWGCKCGVVNHSAGGVERLREQGVNIKTEAPEIEYYEWTDKATGEVKKVPVGIDPGWDYNPGEAAWGRKISKEAMDAWRAQGAKAWERLTPGDWETHGRPADIPADVPKAKMGPTLNTVSAAAQAIRRMLGGKEEKIFSFHSGSFRYDVLVNALSLAEHVDLKRSGFLPFLPEALQDPYEIWLSFERHKGTGKVVLRQRIIKAVRLDKNRGMLLVAQSKNGSWRHGRWSRLLISNI